MRKEVPSQNGNKDREGSRPIITPWTSTRKVWGIPPVWQEKAALYVFHFLPHNNPNGRLCCSDVGLLKKGTEIDCQGRDRRSGGRSSGRLTYSAGTSTKQERHVLYRCRHRACLHRASRRPAVTRVILPRS